MMERKETTMGGNQITLIGPQLKIGATAPDFIVLDNEFLPRTLQDFAGKIKLLNVVPSLDTNVCDIQSQKIEKFGAELSDAVTILTISMDLPFAQERWVRSRSIKNLITLSDHREADFGEKYGILIKEVRLLNRSIFIIDARETIGYMEIVSENNDHPDYQAAFNAVKELENPKKKE